MGTPVEPGEKGRDCPIMTPIPWAAGQTPKYLMVMISGIIRCPGEVNPMPQPPNGAWILTQHPIGPCLWTAAHPDFTMQYQTSNILTYFRIWDKFGWPAFWHTIPGPGHANFNNTVICAGAPTYTLGSAFVDLYDFPGTAYQLLHDYNLAPVAYTKFDVFGCEGEPPYVQVRRFGNVRTPTNIKIKTDATHKDQYETFEL